MKTINKALFVSAFLLAAGSASASSLIDRPVPPASVEACIAEINAQANYTGAARVVHNVDVEQRRPLGHELTIRTLVLKADGETTLRSYATHCTVTPRHVPLQVRIQ
jgi:hypothetical protein